MPSSRFSKPLRVTCVFFGGGGGGGGGSCVLSTPTLCPGAIVGNGDDDGLDTHLTSSCVSNEELLVLVAYISVAGRVTIGR